MRINYVGHSTFLIESPRLVRIATDYNDYVKPPILPDIVTMNRAHSTHYTDRPEPGIKFVLRGWKEDGQPDRPRSPVPGRARALGRHQHPRLWRRRHAAPRQLDLHLRGREPVHRASRPPASHAQPAAAQRDRPRRCRAGAGRRRRDARPRRHDRGADGAEGAADDPDAFLLDLHARPLHCSASARTGTSRRADVPSVVVSKHTLPTKPKLLVLPGRSF